MNARLESLAREREHLVARSALCRLRLGRDAHALRGAVGWGRAAQPLAARVVMLVGRVVLVVKLARAVMGYVRGRTDTAARKGHIASSQ